MLEEITMKNFRSFAKETTINFNSTGYEILNGVNKTEDGILKGALFVGGNATGKTNIIRAIRFLLELLVWQVDIKLFDYKSYFSKIEDKMELTYKFKINDSEIEYFIETSNTKIYKEILKQNGKEILLRLIDKAEYTDNTDKHIEVDVEENQSAVRRIYFDTRFVDNIDLKEWYEFLKNSVYIDQAQKNVICSNNDKFTKNYFENNGKEDFNKFLSLINYNQKVDYVKEYKNKFMQFNFENRNQVVVIRDDMNVGIPIFMESEGNQTLVEVLPQILQAMKNNCMVIIDEFSSAFHNLLEEKIVRYFMENSKRSQLFIVSHSTNLLSNTILRPDQIYTVDYQKNIGSVIYRVSDSKPREAQNLEKMYLGGVFNGVPNIK